MMLYLLMSNSSAALIYPLRKVAESPEKRETRLEKKNCRNELKNKN